MKRKVLMLMLVYALLFQNVGVFAADQPKTAQEKPSTAAILADIFALRLGGLIGTICGTMGFIVSLPVTVPTKKIDPVGEMLVITPLNYTFSRPLGKI
jgi:hypothetical protein